MASILPITLKGDSLGKRHKQINLLVNEVYEQHADTKLLQDAPENSAIDRLFKIDLASKQRDVDYLIKNLKEEDMLYVSRALKARWLLESKYQDIINPFYLENNLYPHMYTTAVNKMKHWIHLNLKDEIRAETFYEFYKDNEFLLAIKFLIKSSTNYLLQEFPKIVHKVTPKYFKFLCERDAQIAKIFYEILSTDEKLVSHYLANQRKFYQGIKPVLKGDPTIYLDIIEKYFDQNSFGRLSSSATDFIMKNHRNRFLEKPELYTAIILDTRTLSENLNELEVKDLIVKLARANYLQHWFSYKNVEPLIKKIQPEERSDYKKKVFVNKDIGDEVEEWPYKPPEAPKVEELGPDVFEDRKHNPQEYVRYGLDGVAKRKIMKKSGKFCHDNYCIMESCPEKIRTELDKLFDEFRFDGFEKTFYELRKRIFAESSSQNRQYILLVLISKTGGRSDAIATLMELLKKHKNEPSHLRATVIRSLVKRAFVWRLPEETWKQLMEFAQGLGLDGTPTEADCIEGLHSVMIRMILNKNVDPCVFQEFLGQFSNFSNYGLNSEEKKCISEELPKLLISTAIEKDDIEKAVDIIHKLIQVLEYYHIQIDTYPGLIDFVVELAAKDYDTCVPLLKNLFRAKIGRKYLFKFNNKLIKTEASLLNALKHDSSVLDFKTFYECCLNSQNVQNFLRKLSIYFNVEGDLANQFRSKLKEKDHNKLIGCPLAILLGSELISHIEVVDKIDQIESKVFAAILRANAHKARPLIDIDSFGWKKAGVKLIANKVTVCPLVSVDKNIEKLLSSKRTLRLALQISKRNKTVVDVFSKVAEQRPSISIKVGYKLLQEDCKNMDTIWSIVKPLIDQINFDKGTKTVYIKKLVSRADNIPMKIRPDYCATIYKSFDKLTSFERLVRLQYLCRIEHLLPDVEEKFIEEVINKYLDEELIPDKLTNKYDDLADNSLFIRVIFTYIYLAKSNEAFERRYQTYGEKMFKLMTEIYKLPGKEDIFFKFLDEILLNFKNTNIFLNPKYHLCLNVMEKTVQWMQTILPIDKHFDKYVIIHLTMLYYKTIRQAGTEMPEVFEVETRKRKEGVKVVGNLFGKYIANEVKVLVAKYFESILFIYKDTLSEYLYNYYNYTESSEFLSAIISGILEHEHDVAPLAMYVFKDKYYNIGEEKACEISKKFVEIRDIKNAYFINGIIY